MDAAALEGLAHDSFFIRFLQEEGAKEAADGDYADRREKYTRADKAKYSQESCSAYIPVSSNHAGHLPCNSFLD